MLHLHWRGSAWSAPVSEGWASSEPWICLCVGPCSGRCWPLLSPPRPLETQRGMTQFISITWFGRTSDWWHQHWAIFTAEFTCLRLILEVAGDLGEEFEGEAGSRLPVTDATFAVARLAALDPVGPVQAVCKERKHSFRVVWAKTGGNDWIWYGPQITVIKRHVTNRHKKKQTDEKPKHLMI